MPADNRGDPLRQTHTRQYLESLVCEAVETMGFVYEILQRNLCHTRGFCAVHVSEEDRTPAGMRADVAPPAGSVLLRPHGLECIEAPPPCGVQNLVGFRT